MAIKQGRIYEFGEFNLNPDEHLLYRGSQQVPLSPRTFDLLVKLVENAGHLLDKDTLIREVWADASVEEGNLNRTISNLRKALGETPTEIRFIQTVPRVGYRFVADVRETTPAEKPVEEIAPATTPPAVPVVQKNRPRWLLPISAAGLLLALLAVGFLWQNRTSRAVNVNEVVAEIRETPPLRLTDDPSDDSHPRWTSDGHIRFFRTDANRQSTSFIMNSDGSGQARVHDVANLKTGIWSPDGRKVVFQKTGDASASYLANADGSNEVALPFFGGNFDWSFDSKELVYQKTLAENNAEIFIYSLATRASRNITNHPSFDADPSFSPDGKKIVFVSGRDDNKEIYLLNIDGAGEPQRLTNHPADDSHPVFSPDGTAIVFTSDRKNESADVYLLTGPTSFSTVVQLTDWPSNETAEPGCWSPDGTRIAFYSDRNGKDDIYVIGAERIGAQMVFSDPKKDLTFASYAPDGKRLVYQAALEDGTGELGIMDLATKQTRVIRKSEVADALPEWSPDAEWIVFQTRVGDNTEVCLIKPDGSAFRNLTNHPAKDITPSWSPDGKQIAFVSNRGKSTQVFQLFVMNADGTNSHSLESTGAMTAAPHWSKFGAIVFANDKEDHHTGNFEIFAIDETGENLRRLTFRKRYDVTPTWSPTDKLIAFVSQSDGNSEIYFVYPNGSFVNRLTRNTAEDLWPRWSPDGQRLIFSSNRSGKFALYEVAL
jgi:Tol biopolymer transport system component/DNA-binding winged helix-turn-helix (wHTH) protein